MCLQISDLAVLGIGLWTLLDKHHYAVLLSSPAYRPLPISDYIWHVCAYRYQTWPCWVSGCGHCWTSTTTPCCSQAPPTRPLPLPIYDYLLHGCGKSSVLIGWKQRAITCFVWPSRAMISNIALPENTPAISLTTRCRFCDVTGTIVIVTLK